MDAGEETIFPSIDFKYRGIWRICKIKIKTWDAPFNCTKEPDFQMIDSTINKTNQI